MFPHKGFFLFTLFILSLLLIIVGKAYYNSVQLSKKEPILLNVSAKANMYDYQINLHFDTIWLYDSGRLVGVIYDNDYKKLEQLILKDNE